MNLARGIIMATSLVSSIALGELTSIVQSGNALKTPFSLKLEDGLLTLDMVDLNGRSVEFKDHALAYRAVLNSDLANFKGEKDEAFGRADKILAAAKKIYGLSDQDVATGGNVLGLNIFGESDHGATTKRLKSSGQILIKVSQKGLLVTTVIPQSLKVYGTPMTRFSSEILREYELYITSKASGYSVITNNSMQETISIGSYTSRDHELSARQPSYQVEPIVRKWSEQNSSLPLRKKLALVNIALADLSEKAGLKYLRVDIPDDFELEDPKHSDAKLSKMLNQHIKEIERLLKKHSS